MTQRIDFIDVSHWQGEIDFALLPKDVLGIIAKATEGTSNDDEMYQANRAGALDAGLAFASYHYLHKGGVAAQMEFYVAKATPRQGERVVIDYEDAAIGASDLKQAVEWLRANRPDLQITVYGANKLADDVNACSDVSWLAETSLWAARYSTSKPKVGKAWQSYSAWQFSQEGKIAGISGNVDLNTFNGSRENCVKWFGPAVPAPAPKPEPVAPLVVIDIVVPDGVSVEVSVNGTIMAHAEAAPA